MRKTIAAVCAVLFLTLGAPGIASAATPGPEDAPSQNDYSPRQQTEPTLAGSAISPVCAADVPWIEYTVRLTDPDGLSTGHDATLTLTDGVNSTTIPLGTVASGGTLEGRVLWPGASVGADGRGDGWPGWENVAGEWVETTGNFAWTRGAVSATIQVNPTLPLSLSYPPSTPACRTAPAGTTPIVAAADVAGALPATGGSSQFLIPVTVGALGVVLVGTVLIVRRRHSRA